MTVLNGTAPVPNCRGEVFFSGEAAIGQVNGLHGSSKVEVTVICYHKEVTAENQLGHKYRGPAYRINMSAEHQMWLRGYADNTPIFAAADQLFKRPDWQPSNYERVMNYLDSSAPYDRVAWADGPFVPKQWSERTKKHE